MARKIIWADEAVSDLDAVAEYIARDSTSYAASFITEVLDAAKSLKELSERGRVVSELGLPDIRELFIGEHRMIYLIEKSRIVILGLVHGRRDLKKLWRGKR